MTGSRVVILGGGTGGTTVPNRLRRRFHPIAPGLHLLGRSDPPAFPTRQLLAPPVRCAPHDPRMPNPTARMAQADQSAKLSRVSESGEASMVDVPAKNETQRVARATGRISMQPATLLAIQSAHIKKGEGTVGALLMDEEVYDNVQEMVRDLKHNPWKFLWRE